MGTVGWGGITLHPDPIGAIPYLANGGDITGGGMALIGERGPEILDLPQGARVTPLAFGANGRGEGTTVINNLSINISGTTLGDDRSMARQLAEILKPELDNLVRLSA